MRNRPLRDATPLERALAAETFELIVREIDPAVGPTVACKNGCVDYLATQYVLQYERGRRSNVAKSRRRPIGELAVRGLRA